MMALLAQAASSGEWHDGQQLAVVTFTALTIVAGLLHRQSKSNLKSVENSLKADIAEVGGDLKDLKDKLYDDARSQAAIYQWQLAATQPAASEASPQQSPPNN